MQETLGYSWVRKFRWRRDRLPTPVFLGFPCGSAGKDSTCTWGDLGSIPRLGSYFGEGKGYPLQYSGLENSIDCIVHGVTKNRTRLSDFHFQTGASFSSYHQTYRYSMDVSSFLPFSLLRPVLPALLLLPSTPASPSTLL